MGPLTQEVEFPLRGLTDLKIVLLTIPVDGLFVLERQVDLAFFFIADAMARKSFDQTHFRLKCIIICYTMGVILFNHLI